MLYASLLAIAFTKRKYTSVFVFVVCLAILSSYFRQDITIFWTYGVQISPKIREVQLMTKAAFVCKEGWTIDGLKMSQMIEAFSLR